MEKVKALHSTGICDIPEVEILLPSMTDDQIEIETKLCGICRSDIGAYMGAEKPMPLGRFGHEGLGVVTKIGKNLIGKVKEGDIVATWSDPAYADKYYANRSEFTIVPEIDPKYILQPVACAINILHKTMTMEAATGDPLSLQPPFDNGLLLIGTGFMSIIIGQFCSNNDIPITVVGNSNIKIWEDMGIELKSMHQVLESGIEYGSIIDLSSKAENFEYLSRLGMKEGLICYASTPFSPVSTNFFENCWKCQTFIMPSPRNSDFPEMMEWTRDLIAEGIINPDIIWTEGYDRRDLNEVKRAFEDGRVRSPGYQRGYLKF